MLPAINGSVEIREGTHHLERSVLTVSGDEFGSGCVQAFCQRTGRIMREEPDGELRLFRSEDLEREEYILLVEKDKIEIRASGEQGVIQALTTVYQYTDANGEIPCMMVKDAPRCRYRGLLLDCVRHFFPIQEIKKILEQMALVKLNILHWGLTNDQGWRIECRSFPRLNEIGGPFYSREEIRDVVSFAAARGIEVIPEIDMPGHVTALLAAYPEYSCSGQLVKLAACGGIYPIILCPGKDKTYKLIESLLEEICPLFPSAYLHIGGDEAPRQEWERCPRCQERIRKEGLRNENELQGYFMNRVIDMARKHRKTSICWNESLAGGNLDEDVMIQYWTVDQAETTKQFVQHGGKMIYSDMFSLYLDYPHLFTPVSRVYGDIPVLDDLDVSEKLYGMETCLWTERIDTVEKLERQLFPRLYAFAETAWTGSRDYEAFLSSLRDFLIGFHPQDIACTPETEWEYTGENRIQQVMAFMNSLTASLSEEAKSGTMEAFSPGPAFLKRFAQCFLGISNLEQLQKYGSFMDEKS